MLETDRQKAQYERNVRAYIAYRFFWGFLIIGPIMTPYMLLQSLSYAEIMILQAIFSISMVVFEVPTGAVSDTISRRLAMCLSGILISGSLFFYIFFPNFYALILAEILFGLGFTFGSGSDAALLYESLDRLGEKERYMKIEGRAAFVVFMGQGFGSVASSLLYTIDPTLPYWISAIAVAIAAGIAWTFTETEREKSDQAYHTHILSSFSQVYHSRNIMWLIGFALVMGVGLRSAVWLYEPYFTHVGIEVFWFGAIFFFFNLIAAVSAKTLTHRYSNEQMVLIGLGIILAISYLLPTLFVSPWAIGIIGIQQIVRGLYNPTKQAYVNRRVKDAYRATMISVVNLAGSLSFSVVSPLVGLSLDRYGPLMTYEWVGWVVAVTTVLLLGMRGWANRTIPVGDNAS